MLITQIFVTRTGGPRLILSGALTALVRGVSGCSKRSEDENLYFVLFTQTEETGQNFGSCLPVERGSGGASIFGGLRACLMKEASVFRLECRQFGRIQ